MDCPACRQSLDESSKGCRCQGCGMFIALAKSPEKDASPRIVRMNAGEPVEVPIDDVWDSICKVLRLSRLLTCPESDAYRATRLAFLAERLADLEGLSFNYRRHKFGSNIDEQFVPEKS